ncbi:related to SOG2 - key component of the RAM signaling network [Melanopsichium pennsylvanicum]|uniref:Related to SOG2 - key component of the RAM signaling network n=2 Tax=Melanopsichium pennsylvanicum TaxID=63383 RepID=A0AAJ5C5A6_9BASI|nr:fog: leucine rich repeat [Melanopsichium pennsylvanicum 4]SNX84373.1 related to SOG2 - key component of the RAM signaling network [Melanopsichium pennsylvanicum]
MQLNQRGIRAPNDTPSSSSATSLGATTNDAAPSASSGIAGIGAGKLGSSTSYRAYAHHQDHNFTAHWNTFDSAQYIDPSQQYAGFPTAASTSSFDTQSRAFDTNSMPSSSSLYASQSLQQLATPSAEGTNAQSYTSLNGLPASSSSQRFISDADLLAFVDDRRRKVSKGASDAPKSTSSNSAQNRSAHANQSTDSVNSLDTLDLCHKRIDRVPEALVDMIKGQVVRLALGYNHITKLPSNFVELHSLRYLNIRANNFAYFPECVTKMPNLEILDLSRNKVRKLPQQPGRLLALRVLSMNANRLTKLPAWVGKMKHLRILKLDNNPLEWPPPHISKMPNVAPPKLSSSAKSSVVDEREKAKRFEDRQMVVWIAKLRSWINDPANQAQSSDAVPIEQLDSMKQDTQALAEPSEQSDLESMLRTDAVEPPSVPSDGLMSLRVQVPESVSDRALKADGQVVTSSSEALSDQTSMVAADVASAGTPSATAPALLPPLVPHAMTKTDLAYADMEPSTSGSSHPHSETRSSSVHDPDGQSAQQRAFGSLSSQTSRAGHSGRSIAVAVHPFAPDETDVRQHARNNSHSVAQDIAATPQVEGRRSLKSKKSLPDLRKSHEDILQERQDVLAEQLPERRAAEMSARTPHELRRDGSQSTNPSITPNDAVMALCSSTAAQTSTRKPLLQTRRMPRPGLGIGNSPSARQGHETAASGLPNFGAQNGVHSAGAPSQGGGLRKLSLPTVGATQAAAEAAAAALAARAGYSNNTPPRFDLGHGRMASDRAADNIWPTRSASPTVNGSRSAADQERNSYFRRLSTLPPSTISKAVPMPVLKFVDGTRGVLFALSQIHAAIGQFMTPVIDERISSQFHRLLDISNGSVANLINALDRFDSLSRRGTPDPSVIRGVLVTCKDSVITFRKLISVLQLQLRALQSSSDVRYGRTLLLMLFGSMAEVSNSWTEMAPLVEAVQPYLTQAELDSSFPVSSDAATAVVEKPTPHFVRAGTLVQKSISSTNAGSTTALPSIAEASAPLRVASRPYLARGPSRRRHAGSFSAQDLAQGAAMTPSTSNPPFNLEDLQAASAYNTPARGARSRRQGSWGNSASSAATFAHSDSSERSGAVEGTQSTAPSTPGGSAITASHRTIYATPSAMSTPTSSRQKRSGSSASSAIEVPPLTGSTDGLTPRSQAGTPITPAAATGKRHVASQSTGTAGSVAATTAAGARLHMAVSDPKIAVDDHLLDMIDNITKLSARVWSMLFEHLRPVDVDAKPKDLADGSSAGDDGESRQLALVDGVNGPETVEGDSGKEGSEGNTALKAEQSQDMQKLRELAELAQVTDDLTSQLRSTYLCAREEESGRASLDSNPSPPVTAMERSADDALKEQHEAVVTAAVTHTRAVVGASTDNICQETVAKLFDESHQFVRAIINTSTLIKSISVSHEFPKDLRRMLGQVAQACSNLTVYLLWLSPTSVA